MDWRVVTGDGFLAPARAVEGARVCVDGHPEVACATTDAGGSFKLQGVPAREDLIVTVDKEGFLPTLEMLQTNAEFYVPMRVPIAVHRASDLPQYLDVAVDTTGTGVLTFFAFAFNGKTTPDALPGVQVALSPATGGGPFYFNKNRKFDGTLKATDNFKGPFADDNVSSGLFLNVAPGDYKVTFTPPAGYTCSPLGAPFAWGLPIDGESAVRATVRAGHLTTSIGMHCEGAPPAASGAL